MMKNPRLCLALLFFCFLWPVTRRATAQSTNLTQAAYQKTIEAAVAKISPSVVQIETVGGLDVIDGKPVGRGPRTGFCIRPGYVATSRFNLAHQPAGIFLRFSNGERVPADVVGVDSLYQVVVLKFDTPEKLRPVQFADLSKVRVGHKVVAVGKTYDSKEPNVSVGILSAKGRIQGRAVQTDAKVSSVNYGGPLINLRGEVLGMLAPLTLRRQGVTAGTEWYDSGVGFAVRLDQLLLHWQRLVAEGKLRPGIHGLSWVGKNIYADPAKVLLVPGGTPARKAGLRSKDKVVECNGLPVSRIAQWNQITGGLYAGDRIKLIVQRDGRDVRMEFELVDQLAAYQRPELGVLVSQSPEGVQVESILGPKSALRKGDVIREFNTQIAKDRLGLERLIAQAVIGESANLKIVRDQKEMELEVELRKQSAEPSPDLKIFANTKLKKLEISVSDFANQAVAWYPEEDCEGLLVWLAAPGEMRGDRIEKIWRRAMVGNRVGLMVLRSEQPEKWRADEAEFVTRALQIFLEKAKSINPQNRDVGVAIGGTGAAGTMAALVCMNHRSRFRGLVLNHAEYSVALDPPETDPSEPLLIFLNQIPESKAKGKRVVARTERILREAEFPVYSQSSIENETESAERFLYWVRALHRL